MDRIYSSLGACRCFYEAFLNIALDFRLSKMQKKKNQSNSSFPQSAVGGDLARHV